MRPVLRRLSGPAAVAIVAACAGLTLIMSAPAMAGPDAAAAEGTVRGAGAAGALKDSYIVVLKDRAASADRVRGSAADLVRRYGGTVRQLFSSTVRGFSARMTEDQARRVAARPGVAYVEQDHTVSVSATQTDPPSWGLDRIDQRSLPLDGRYTYPTTASTVHAYVIDSGVRISNREFGGRASYGYDFVDNDSVADDCFGHGTHVAGTIGGSSYGVAKAVQLVSVRVLGCDGSGSYSQIIAGIEWVTAHAAKPAVANMSLGGPGDATVDAAVSASIAQGITYAVAAGNSATDACTVSPARVPAAITVGATDNTDTRASFSNYGNCVDIFAPGVNITSAYNTSDTATAVMNGTSMATPHVAGAAALLLAQQPTLTPQQVRDTLVGGAVSGAVGNAGSGSPTGLLQAPAAVPAPVPAPVGATPTPTPVTATPAPVTTAPAPVRTTTPTPVQTTPAPVQTQVVSLRAHANGRYVTAENGGASALIANRTAIGAWEQFDEVDAGNGYVALRAHANGCYVTAESAGAASLIANRSAVGTWEKFQVVNNPDGSISLLANADGRDVTAESGGAASLIANRGAIGSWEEFDLIAS